MSTTPSASPSTATTSRQGLPAAALQALEDFRTFFALARPYRLWLWGGAALSALTVIAGLALLGVAAGLIAMAAVSGGGLGIAVLARGRGLGGVSLLRTGARYAERLTTHEATFRILADIRLWVFRHAIPLSPGRLDVLRGGDVLARLTADVDALDGLYLRVTTPAIAAAAGLATALVVIGLAAPAAALVTGVLFLATCAGAPALTLYAAAAPGRRAADAAADLRAEAADLVEGIAELKAFSAEERALAALDQAAERGLAAQRQARAAGALSAGVLTAAGPLTALAAALTAAGGGAGVAGILVTAFVALALFEAAPPLVQAAEEAGRVARSARRVRALAAMAPTAGEPADAGASNAAPPRAATPTPHITFDDVSLTYPDAATPALDSVSLDLPPGARVALVGPSGAGKSSVFHLLMRFYDPTQGAIRIDGVDVAATAQADTRGRLAYMGQRPGLISANLRDNLRLAAPDADDATLTRALEQARLTDLLQRLPEGLDTWIGADGQLLSGGQARRVALARAILTDAPVLLLDEPTEGLDAPTEALLVAAISDYVRDAGRTVVLASHRPALTMIADRRVSLARGRVVADDAVAPA